ncbi:MAG: insulinase family protein [Armatimonadetes bacterium]|nr:insulinase family protein [Armatimonadota bacterium]
MTLRNLRLVPFVTMALGWLAVSGFPPARAGDILDPEMVTQTTLPNGLRVVVKEAPGIDLVVLNVWVRAGSADETEENNGVSHFLEHMMFKGTKKRGPLEFQKEIEELGGMANASSTEDAAQYWVVVRAQHIAPAVEALGDVMTNPTFPAEQMRVEANTIQKELAEAETNPEQILADWVGRLSYRVHPYRLPTAGTRDSVRRITREKVVEFYDKHYVAGNMSLVVVGAVKAAEVLPKIEAAFGGLRAGTPPERAYQPEAVPTETQFRVLTVPNLSRGYQMLGFRAPGMENKEDVCAMDVLLYVLGERRAEAGRLNRELRSRQRLVSAVWADYVTLRHPGLVTFWTESEPSKVEAAREALLAQIAQVRDNLVPADEIQRAKTLLLGVYTLDNETYDGQAGTLGFYEAKDTYRFALEYTERIRGVTPEDIRRVARQYLAEKSHSLAVMKPKMPEGVVEAPGGTGPLDVAAEENP